MGPFSNLSNHGKLDDWSSAATVPGTGVRQDVGTAHAALDQVPAPSPMSVPGMPFSASPTPHRPLQLSERARHLQPSLTLGIAAKAKQLKQEGRDICSLSAGEPDFDTPTFIREAAADALAAGHTRYGPAAGEPALREAIAAKISRENAVPTAACEVLVCNGGKQALFNLFQVLLGPGDEVLLPSPYWLSYPEIARLAGASVKLLPSRAEAGFRLEPDLLESSIGPASRLLVLNSPGNPTGAVLSRDELETIAKVLRRHPQVVVVCDEIYEYLLAPGQQHHSLAAVAPDLRHRVFSVNGFAKGWSMTGWRIGWLSGPKEVITAAAALQSQSTSNVCTFAQYGALAAVEGPRTCVQAMAEQFNQRRSLLSAGLLAIPGLKLHPPAGAFYAFPDVSHYGLDSMTLCTQLLESCGLAVVPGVAFGDDRCIRLSCAAAPVTIEDGLNRLHTFLTSL